MKLVYDRVTIENIVHETSYQLSTSRLFETYDTETGDEIITFFHLPIQFLTPEATRIGFPSLDCSKKLEGFVGAKKYGYDLEINGDMYCRFSPNFYQDTGIWYLIPADVYWGYSASHFNSLEELSEDELEDLKIIRKVELLDNGLEENKGRTFASEALLMQINGAFGSYEGIAEEGVYLSGYSNLVNRKQNLFFHVSRNGVDAALHFSHFKLVY